MKTLLAILGFALVSGLVACNSSDKEKAKQQAREDVRETTEEAKKAGRKIKEDAKELRRRVEATVQSDGESASDKMSHAEAKTKDAASHAGVKLDHAALLAKVKTKLASDAGLSTLTNIDVAVDGSVVTLSGTVANENQKKAAEIAASQVDGIIKVKNRLALQAR
jgi:osmotically-inducible protein OsmY